MFSHFHWHTDDDFLRGLLVEISHYVQTIDDALFFNRVEDLIFNTQQLTECLKDNIEEFRDNTEIHKFMGKLMSLLPISGLILISIYTHDDDLLAFMRTSLKNASDKVKPPGILRIDGYNINLDDWFGPWPDQSSLLQTQWSRDLQELVWDLWLNYNFPYPYERSLVPSEVENGYLTLLEVRQRRLAGIIHSSDEEDQGWGEEDW